MGIVGDIWYGKERMKNRLFSKNKLLPILVTIVGMGFAPVLAEAEGGKDPKKVRIGFAMDTLREERWMRDKELFIKAAHERGAEVLIQAANGNDALQYSQAENLLTQGIDVLVV